MGLSSDVMEESPPLESTSEEITRLLLATEERGRILAQRTALLSEQVIAVAESNKIARRDLVAREQLVAECKEIKTSVAELVSGLYVALERQTTAEQIKQFSNRIALLIQVVTQLVTAVALLGRNDESSKELEQLRKDMVALLAQAVKHDAADVNVTSMGQIQGDLSGNVAGGNIEGKE